MADRVLIHIPIIHTQAEMGTLAKEIGSRLAKELGPRWLQEKETAVDSFWDGIETMLAEVDLPHARVRIYQDGLPVCGREMEIVNELANAGSRNHRLIAELAKKGRDDNGHRIRGASHRGVPAREADPRPIGRGGET